MSYVKKCFPPLNSLRARAAYVTRRAKALVKGERAVSFLETTENGGEERGSGLSACEDMHALHPCHSLPSSQIVEPIIVSFT